MKPFLPLLLLPLLTSLPTPAPGQTGAGPKPIPPPGIEVPEDVRRDLTAGAAELAKEIEATRGAIDPKLREFLPDVQIFEKAVDWALRYHEFFEAKEFETAKKLLATGMERAVALRKGQTPWTSQTGLVVRGYRSVIDDSIQPYGLVIPEDWKPEDKTPRRLDFWFHGRGEKLTELAFLDDRMRNRGEFTPQGTIVAHLYGRFCNANKFAGEQDLFETWNNVRGHYPIDENRVVVRGFSMGGASTWQFATHHAGEWAAAAPGAGFAESAEFLHAFALGKEPPPWWEQVLWRWYDSTLYAANLANCPVVAYSGEIDGQRQAATIMERFMQAEGLKLTQVIGPQTGHKYHPESKPKIDEFVDAAAQKGRPKEPAKVHLTTYTPIYSRMRWVRILGLEKPWERADVDAETQGPLLVVKTKNVSALNFTAEVSPEIKDVRIDDAGLPAAAGQGGMLFHKENGKWTNGYSPERGGSPIKTPTVCGPIDHAFMSRYVMVRPTGQPLNAAAGAWAKQEMEHAISFWRAVFRGEPLVKDDTAVTAEDIATANLILWGDPSSNAMIKRLAAKLPMEWTAGTLTFAGQKYDPTTHMPLLAYPNPLNAKHYIVLNSGVTFREQALLNNADQTPKLPDWAILDIRTPADGKWPGLVVDAGFFDSQWKFQ